MTIAVKRITPLDEMRKRMRERGAHHGPATTRSVGSVILALVGVLVLGVAATLGSAISLAATTALINGASGLPKPADKPGYIFGVADHLLAPNTACNAMTNPPCDLIPVNGPETIWPFIGGLSGLTFDKSVAEGLKNLNLEYEAVRAADPDGDLIIFGYSQSGNIVTKQLRAIAKDPNRPAPEQLQFLIVGNTNRPNGGLLSRLTPLYIPIFNASFDGPTPTDTGYQGTDIAFYYDGIADFPTYPLNLLATVNALFGFLTIHPTYPAPNPALGEYTQAEYQAAMADPANRQTFGDTTFITLPIKNLPILHIPRALAAKTGTTFLVEPLLDLIEPTLTVLIELGYDRTIPYGQFTTAGLFPIIDPIKLAADLVGAAVQGVEEALQDLRSPAQPTEELVQSNPFPFLDLNPFSAPYVNLPEDEPATSSAEALAASQVSAEPTTEDVPASDAAELPSGEDASPAEQVAAESGDTSATSGEVADQQSTPKDARAPRSTRSAYKAAQENSATSPESAESSGDASPKDESSDTADSPSGSSDSAGSSSNTEKDTAKDTDKGNEKGADSPSTGNDD